MKRLQLVVLTPVAVLAIGGVVYGVSSLSRSALPPAEDNIVDCTKMSTDFMEYVVTIQNGELNINNIQAKPCDVLTIVNADDQLRLMAFGIHEKHQTYGGVTEETLKPGEQMSVTLEQTGTYTFHDHLHDEVKGTFTVQ